MTVRHPLLNRAISAVWVLVVFFGVMLAYLGIAMLVVRTGLTAVPATIVADLVIVAVVLLVRQHPRWLSIASPRAEAEGRPGFVSLTTQTLLVLLAGQAIALTLYTIVGSESFQRQSDAQQADAWLYLVLTIAIAPVAEELMLRGFVYPLLRQRVGIVVATIVTTVMFSLIHGNLVQAILVIPLGVLLCVLYERYRSPWPGVLVHLSFNVAAQLLPGPVIQALATPIIAIVLGSVCAASLTQYARRSLGPVAAVPGLASEG